MALQMFSEKDPGETASYAMDFSPTLASGETISSSSVGVSTYSGTDASPSALLSGSSGVTGSLVQQALTGGSDGVTYRVRFVATTSASRVLVACGYLPVNNQ